MLVPSGNPPSVCITASRVSTNNGESWREEAGALTLGLRPSPLLEFRRVYSLSANSGEYALERWEDSFWLALFLVSTSTMGELLCRIRISSGWVDWRP